MFYLKVKDVLHPPSEIGQSDAHHDCQWPLSARKTDPEGWRLTVEKGSGRLIWRYLRTDQERNELPQDATTRYYMGRETVCSFWLNLGTIEQLIDWNSSLLFLTYHRDLRKQ